MRVKRARTEAPRWGEENPLPNQERAFALTAHFFPFEPLAKVPLPRTGARSPSGNSRGGCRGCISLDWTQCDMMKEGTEDFEFEF